MSVRVSLNVYSGRPNPYWDLAEAQAEALLEQVERLNQGTTSKPPGVIGGLGYRGFLVERSASSAEGPLSLYVHEGIVDKGQSQMNVIDADQTVERSLLESGRQAIDAELYGYVSGEIANRRDVGALLQATGIAPAGCPHCQAADAPPYNPGKWNIPTVQPHNNCYNYANDQITNTFAQPGRAHGKTVPPNPTCPTTQPCAVADGLAPSPGGFGGHLGPGQGWYVALVVWPGRDYHWYRQDNVGCWSHKPGQTAARNFDGAGAAIADPRTCNRGPYTDFCGYMITTRHVVIR
jgi:hypothetical protein